MPDARCEDNHGFARIAGKGWVPKLGMEAILATVPPPRNLYEVFTRIDFQRNIAETKQLKAKHRE
jgi:hypothetical protein